MCHYWAEKLLIVIIHNVSTHKTAQKKALNLLHPVFPDTKDLMCFTKLCDMFIVAKSLWQIRIFIILKEICFDSSVRRSDSNINSSGT